MSSTPSPDRAPAEARRTAVDHVLRAFTARSEDPEDVASGVYALLALGVTYREVDEALRGQRGPGVAWHALRSPGLWWCGTTTEHTAHRHTAHGMPGLLCIGRAAAEPRADGHVLVVHPPGHHDDDGDIFCMFCEGGVRGCTRCGAAEGTWPDMCPGDKMTREQSDAVYRGVLNYRDGEWCPGECCQVMRPIWQREEYLTEHGYRQDETGRWMRTGEAST